MKKPTIRGTAKAAGDEGKSKDALQDSNEIGLSFKDENITGSGLTPAAWQQAQAAIAEATTRQDSFSWVDADDTVVVDTKAEFR